MSTLTAPSGATTTTRPPVSAAWSQAGFGRHAADVWRRAGWTDAGMAADWLAASPDDSPAVLRQLADAGYTPGQLRQTSRATRRHVGAWAAALLPPEHGGSPIARDRAVVANCVLAQHLTDDDGTTIIDLR